MAQEELSLLRREKQVGVDWDSRERGKRSQ
jgi:hypothetical protein